MNTTDPTLIAIDCLASRRYGVIAHDEAVAAGLSPFQIARLVKSGRWMRAVPGVYLVAGAPESFQQSALAACRVAGRDAVASHLTALALLGAGTPPIVPHITVPKSKSARTRIAVVHRSNVPELDRTTAGVIECTTASRSLVDIAPLIAVDDLRGLVDTVFTRRLATPSTVLGSVRRAGKGRRGIPRLMGAMTPWLSGVRPGSPGEARLLRRLDEWGFPVPKRQWMVQAEGRSAILDLAWPAHRVGLEYDGQLSHTPRELAADVSRDEWLGTHGWWIGRVDHDDLRPSSTRLRSELRRRLSSARAA